ncbi:MAG: site-2 protease family protein [Planctomycetaceae bacterium]
MFSISPTPFDLQFHLGRIPVRVHPGFWLVGIIGGWNPEDFRITFIWVVCLFASILIHELGHALTAEAFDWPSEILLYHFGGLAFSQRYHNNTPWRSIAVSLAGPGAGFAFYALIQAVVLFAGRTAWMRDPYVREAILQLSYINLWWGLVNLAPVLPLDGGRVCESFLEWLRVRNAEQRVLQISLIVGGLMAWWFLTHHNRFAGMLFLFLTLNNFSSLQETRRRW